MRFVWGAAISAAALSMCFAVASSFAADLSEQPPAWAFPINPPHHSSGAPKPDAVEHVAGSNAAYTDKQLNDEFFAADWFPKEHGAAPDVVLHGHKPHVPACGYCHLPTGTGGPAEAALPGLPASYVVEQVMEMKAGRRHAAQPNMLSPQGMEELARNVSAADLQAAAQYFSHETFKSHFHVVEADVVPKTAVLGVSVYGVAPGGGTEPLGQRIVEVANDMKQWEIGNPRTDFTAYVPKGSVARGKTLVASGDGETPCTACHGADLKGSLIAPPLAGRSPSYLARQLFDIQYGTRRGPTVALMVPEVTHMTAADRIAIVAYLGSLRP
jgi:cytochrome c553